MASLTLLERMNMSADGAVGPVRSKSGPGGRKSSPYTRAPKGDVESAWNHDMFEQHNSLSARMNIAPSAPKANLAGNPMLGRALQAATGTGGSGLTIKGAAQGNVVEVTGLVAGTTADDVVAIFKRCGDIVKGTAVSGRDVVIRVTFKTPAGAAAAVRSFHGQQADGKTLSVRIVGTNATSLSLGGRLGGADGLGLVREEGSVDVLMESAEGSSKMRSDSLTADPRAQVLVAPPGADPKDYTQQSGGRGGGRGGRGRGRGGRGRGGKRGGRMDVD